MKKSILWRLSAMLVATMMLAACGGGGGEGPDDPPGPPPPPPPPASAISIDGEFADWDALSATTAPKFEFIPYDDSANKLVQAKVVRGYVNEDAVYVYVEFSDTPNAIMNLQVQIDSDNSKSTGTTIDDSWYFDGGVEYLAEGQLFNTETNQYVSFDPGLMSWGEDLIWSGGIYFAIEEVQKGSGVGEGSIPVELDNGNKAVEVCIYKAMFPAGKVVWGEETAIGVSVVDVAWAECGRIPNNAENTIPSMLVVPLTIE